MHLHLPVSDYFTYDHLICKGHQQKFAMFHITTQSYPTLQHIIGNSVKHKKQFKITNYYKKKVKRQ